MREPFEASVIVSHDEIPLMLQSQDKQACAGMIPLDLHIRVTRDPYGDVSWELAAVEALDSGYMIAADPETCEPVERRLVEAAEREMGMNKRLRQKIEDAIDQVMPPYDYNAEHRIGAFETLGIRGGR